jgi:hypothetical protein
VGVGLRVSGGRFPRNGCSRTTCSTFAVVKGQRSIIDNVRNVSTPTKTCHTLAVELREKQLSGELDGWKWRRKALDAVPRGKVGLWSKADSQVLFDDFEVIRIKGTGA